MPFIPMFAVALLLALIAAPLTGRFALRNGLTDHPGERKLHRDPKPFLGGLCIFFSGSATVLAFHPFLHCGCALWSGAALLFLVGAADDCYDLKPRCKLAGQCGAALLYFGLSAAGYGILPGSFEQPPLLRWALLLSAAAWMVFLINAFNLIDGVDGLATGVAVIAGGALALFACAAGAALPLGLLLIGLGAALGFLPYNFPPARIFLGDAGAMLLGFFLAALHGMLLGAAPLTFPVLLGSLFLFAYPVLDVTFAVLRRLIRRQPIFQGDCGHLHHLLLRCGLPARKAVLLLYLGSFGMAGLGLFLFSRASGRTAASVLGVLFAGGTFLLYRLLLRLDCPAAAQSTLDKRPSLLPRGGP